MKSPYILPVSNRTLALGAGLSLFALSASIASAQLIAYEGIDNPELVPGVLALPDGSPLALLPATGFGFVDSWTPTSKSNGTASHYSANGGFSYPAGLGGDLPGTEKAGGVAVVQGDWDADTDVDFDGSVGGNAFYRLNLGLAEAAAVNGSGKVYISYLTAPMGPEATNPALTNPFPRNQGARIPELAGANNNNSLGMIGLNGRTTPGYAAWGFKDTNGLQSGADATLGEADFIVVELNLDADKVSFWVNPLASGTEGFAQFFFTDDGDSKDLSYYAFGGEAGQGDYMPPPSGSGNWVPDPDGRPAGSVAFDEIRIGADLYSVLGRETIPEPSIVGFMGFGFVGMLLAFRRRRA